ncbi:MAG: nucleoside triphosphate pyrophosphohydrolase [Clostridia bacterium]|nr:nucleoside triphosphate pyrophosphohydrolase [Clostridia bacterium]
MQKRIEALKTKKNYNINDLREIMEILRSPEGCPWDREQDHKSIRRDLIEETYEAIEAIDTDNNTLMCEELGDLMLQVVFHSRIAEEAGDFSLDDVADGICKKLILRHPHVFADVSADTSDEVLKNWDKIKVVEKQQKSDREVLDSVSHSLPSLIRADKLASKAKKLGIAVPEDDAINSLSDNISDREKFIGDLLFSVVSLAKKLGVDGEKALGDACDRVVLSASDIKKR